MIGETVAQIRSSEFTIVGWLCIAIIFGGACCLLFGLVTPIAAIVLALISAILVFYSLHFPSQYVNLAVLSTAIALLGPGAFSIDARMFGRREILIRSSKT